MSVLVPLRQTLNTQHQESIQNGHVWGLSLLLPCLLWDGIVHYCNVSAAVKQLFIPISYPILNDDLIKWKHFPCYWPFVWGIHRSPVNSPHKGQWHGGLMFFFIYAWISGWVNIREAGDMRHHHVHYYTIIVMLLWRGTHFPNYSWIYNSILQKKYLYSNFNLNVLRHCVNPCALQCYATLVSWYYT